MEGFLAIPFAGGMRDRASSLPVHLDELESSTLISYRVIVDLIGATATETGLAVRCELDENVHQKEIVVSDREMAEINITRSPFRREWNYTIHPFKILVEAINSG